MPGEGLWNVHLNDTIPEKKVDIHEDNFFSN